MNALILTILLTAVTGDFDRPPEPTMPKDPSTGLFAYEGVETVEGVPAADLYSRAKAFIAEGYRSAQAVVQLDDPDAHRLVVRGNFSIPYLTAELAIEHKLLIEVKDGRYRYRLDGFDAVWPNGTRRELEHKYVVNTKIVTRTAAQADALIAGLRASMIRAPKEW